MYIKAGFKKIKNQAMEWLTFKTEMYIKEIGKKIKWQVEEN